MDDQPGRSGEALDHRDLNQDLLVFATDALAGLSGLAGNEPTYSLAELAVWHVAA